MQGRPRLDAMPAMPPAAPGPVASGGGAPIYEPRSGIGLRSTWSIRIAPLADRLPDASFSRLRALGEAQEELAELAYRIATDQADTRTELRRRKARLEEVRATPVRRPLRPIGVDQPGYEHVLPSGEVRDRQLRFAQREAQEAQLYLQRLDERAAELKSRRSALAARCLDYVGRLPAVQPIEAYSGPTPKLPKGEPADVVDKLREDLARLSADLHQVRSAPYPASVAKTIARAEVERLAAIGEPDVLRCIGLGPGHPPGFPMTTIRPPGAPVPIPVLDAAALTAWLHKEELVARLESTIDDLADDANALDVQQRRDREADILNAILAVERAEALVIEQAAAAGTQVRSRDDLDPRAALWLSDELPAPTRR